MKLAEWLRNNKLLLILLVFLFLGYQFVYSLFGGRPTLLPRPTSDTERAQFGMAQLNIAPSFSLEQKTQSSTDRLVVQNSNLSLLVKDVRETGDKIVAHAKQIGGFMVTTSYSRPTESPFATITVRVPSSMFDETLGYYRSLSLKVTNENLVGEDITETYINIDERINTLLRTKEKFESILDTAITTQELLNVQRELTNIQSQIDALTGQKIALEKNASFSKITIYLSTDELALPYTPEESFRPDIVFKLAVRSLLNTLRIVGEAAIWVAVYAVVWVPVLGGYLLLRRLRQRRQPTK